MTKWQPYIYVELSDKFNINTVIQKHLNNCNTLESRAKLYHVLLDEAEHQTNQENKQALFEACELIYTSMTGKIITLQKNFMSLKQRVQVAMAKIEELAVKQPKHSFALKFGMDYETDDLNDFWDGKKESDKFTNHLEAYVKYETVKNQ